MEREREDGETERERFLRTRGGEREGEHKRRHKERKIFRVLRLKDKRDDRGLGCGSFAIQV